MPFTFSQELKERRNRSEINDLVNVGIVYTRVDNDESRIKLTHYINPEPRSVPHEKFYLLTCLLR